MRELTHEKTILHLLEFACPSIRYRLYAEGLTQPPPLKEMTALQNLILKDKLVQEVVQWGEPDEWKSSTFHGTEGIEAGVRILREKGVALTHPAITSALDRLEHESDILYRGIGRPGKILDDMGFGGSNMIRAVVFAYAGVEARSFLGDQMEIALGGFESLLPVSAIEEVTRRYKNKLIFKPGAKWPSIYHLRLLAFTQSWRTKGNYRLVLEGTKRLVALSPIPQIHVLANSQLVAPASFGIHDFNPDMDAMDAAGWMEWFMRMELLSRIGVVGSIPELQNQVDKLNQMLEEDDGWFTKALNHSSFRDWGVYNGLQLERDWRSAKRRMYDLTFRSLLIRHFANQKQI